MAKLTADEVDELVRAKIEQCGKADHVIFLQVWRTVVDRILERLECLEDREFQLEFAKEVVQVWGDVVTGAGGPNDARYVYLAHELSKLFELYGSLNDLAIKACLLLDWLPCADDGSRPEALAFLNDVSEFINESVDLLEAAKRQDAGVYITGDGYNNIALRCMTLLSYVLGKPATAIFKEQYDMSIGVINSYAKMAAADTGRPN